LQSIQARAWHKNDKSNQLSILILISADAEWEAVKENLCPPDIQTTPPGKTFITTLVTGKQETEVRFFHGGWGKISAAATTQYVIDRWQPEVLVNLGTCGGFAGKIEKGAIILVEKTIVYDIIEQMTDPEEAIEHYSTELDLSWFDDGLSVVENNKPAMVRGLLVSADRDIVAEEIPRLIEKYGAVAADWESGAIAWVAKKNGIRCLILRGVTDLVSPEGGEAYGDIGIFHENTKKVMRQLVEELPRWLKNITTTPPKSAKQENTKDSQE
jgi:adenosylhomocysteine nucleosidase